MVTRKRWLLETRCRDTTEKFCNSLVVTSDFEKYKLGRRKSRECSQLELFTEIDDRSKTKDFLD